MTFCILLAEDNESDAELVSECLEDWDRDVHLRRALDGVEALRLLRDGRHPDLVLLDINMPHRDGLSVLREMKEDPKLRTIPVVMLTSSTARSDVATAYERHANTFFQKPMSYAGYEHLLHLIEQYWVAATRLRR